MDGIKSQLNDLKDKQSKKDWWQKELAECIHCYKIPEHNLFLPFKNSEKICVDIGANVGTFSYYASNFFNHVYSYEAIKSTYKVAKENLKDIKNVTIYNMAATNKAEMEIKLAAHSSGLSGDSSIYNVSSKKPYEICKTIDIESIYLDNKINYIDYLKVDCEGSEYEFLIGKDLSKINFLVMELHTGYLKEDKSKELLDYIEGYFKLEFKVGEHIFFFSSKQD